MHLTTMLESTARKFPQKDALISGEEHLSYAQLLAASRRAAGVIRVAGVKPGDRVAVMTFNTPAFVIADFGIWRAGAVLVPINHKLQVPEVKYLVEHSEAAPTSMRTILPSCSTPRERQRIRRDACTPTAD